MPNIIQSLTSAKKKIILGMLFLLAGTYLATILLINSQNILYKNDFWFPYRANFFAMRGQGIESLLERSMIAGEKLRTHHQRVFSKRIVEPKSIRFKMRYQINNFVDIIFNGDNETFESVRVSSEHWRPSMYYKTKHTGEYLAKILLNFKAEPYQTLDVELKDEDGNLFLLINDDKFPVAGHFSKGKVGFDLSENSEIWEPKIITKDGEVIDAAFALSESKIGYYFKNLLIFGLIIFVLIFLTKEKSLRFFQTTLFFFLFSTLAFAFDNYYYSFKIFRFMAKEFTFRQIRRDYMIDPEDIRYRFFKKWYEALGGSTPTVAELKSKNLWPNRFFRSRYCDSERNCKTFYDKLLPDFGDKSKDTVRILIWGGSLSAGSGLTTLDESYPEVIQKNLNVHYKGKKKIEILNSSRGDMVYEIHFPMILDDIKKFRPDFIYLDTIPPENNPQMLEPMYRQIITEVPNVIFQRLPIRYDQYTNVSLERIRGLVGRGLIPEEGGFFFFRNDFIIKKWVDEMGLIFVDPNGDLLADKVLFHSHLFWDATHLTPYGHQVWGEYLSKHLIRLL